MSVDPLGRVIVGSGHLIERIPGIVNTATQVVVGGGHFDHIYNSASQVVQNARAVSDHWSNWINRVVDDRIPETTREAYNREVEERLHRLVGAGGDILEAYAWASSGDLQQAWERLVDAAVATGQVFAENLANPPPTHN